MKGYEALFDELNVLFDQMVEEYIKKTSKEDEDFYEDYLGYLLMIQESQDAFTEEMLSFFSEALHKSHKVAVDDVCEELGFTPPVSYDEQTAETLIMQPIDGKTYEDRVREYAQSGEIDRLRVVLNTESHRVYNQTGQQTAEDAQGDKLGDYTPEYKPNEYNPVTGAYNESQGIQIYKQWMTMRDPKVRETHRYIDAEKVPLNERFYTFDGDSALVPSGFSNPENNINCRCWVTYSY